MRKIQRLRFKFVPFAGIVAVVGSLLLALMIAKHEKTFPALKPGAYVGKLSGISKNDKEYSTLYVERIGSSDALLFVAFKEGWKPLVLPLKQSKQKGSLMHYQPLRIEYAGTTFTLHGAQSGEDFSGEVISDSGKRGVWTITAISAEELRNDDDAKLIESDLEDWLRNKERYEELLNAKTELDQIVSSQDERLASLQEHVSEQTKLRSRAQLRINDLTSKLEQGKELSSETSKRLRRHVRELDQLLRITKTGRTIDLARRAAKRENKWYEANWQKGADLSGIEESLANKMNVDLRKLGRNVQAAKEYRTLKNTIARERKKIRKLEKMYRQGTRGGNEQQVSPPTAPVKTPKPEKTNKKRPWWKKVERAFR